MSKRKTSKSTAVGPVRQANGQLVGGNPGNRGGTGRPPSVVRAAARARFDELLPMLSEIAKKKGTLARDRIRAADVLGKYGMDQSVSIADIRECLREQREEIFEFLPEEQAQQLLERLRPIWLKL